MARLTQLETLKLEGVRKASEFSPTTNLPSLRKLFITNAKHLSDLKFLSNAHRLESLGVEGDMWTKQKIDSLEPISHLERLEALFMTSVTLVDKTLTYLATMPRLRVLECARFAPREQFSALRELCTNLECSWCDDYEIRIS